LIVNRLDPFFEDRLIAIDPGHGGSDCGGRGPVSLVEKDITLKIGKLLGHALEQEGAGVVLTRTYDKDVSMQERFGRVSDFGADILVSIHAFSSDDRKVSGARTLYCEDPTEKSLALAKCIHTSLVEKLPVANRQMSVSPMRLPNDFRIPYVVVEIAAITNWVDEGWLRNPTFPTPFKIPAVVCCKHKNTALNAIISKSGPAPG
jgi:N-acetylmuramoyl-L-alanine amidase